MTTRRVCALWTGETLFKGETYFAESLTMTYQLRLARWLQANARPPVLAEPVKASCYPEKLYYMPKYHADRSLPPRRSTQCVPEGRASRVYEGERDVRRVDSYFAEQSLHVYQLRLARWARFCPAPEEHSDMWQDQSEPLLT